MADPRSLRQLARMIHHAAACDRRGAGITWRTADSLVKYVQYYLAALPGVRPVPPHPAEILRGPAVPSRMMITTCLIL